MSFEPSALAVLAPLQSYDAVPRLLGAVCMPRYCEELA